MVSILAIDTASRRRGLCVLAGEDGALLDHGAVGGRELDRELAPAVAALLSSGAPELRAVAVVVGPGSYTGLRVGIAAALGVAHARQLPLHGVGALDVVALAAPEGSSHIEAVADAGRGALYVARLHRGADGSLRSLAEPRRVEAAGWRPHPGAVAVSLDAVDGALDAGASAASALARAAAATVALTPPLSRAGLEPVYLSGNPAHAPHPRV